MPAPAAAAREHHVTDHWNVVEPGNHLIAFGAKRTRLHHRQVARHAVNADVEKAANEQAGERGQQGFHHLRGLMFLALAYFRKLYSAAMYAIASPSEPSRNPRRPT